MLYYQVLPQFDQKHTTYKYKNNKPIWNGLFHIANELLTEKEVEKYGYKKEYCKQIEISKKQTYFFFGARFPKKGGNK